MHQTKNTKDEYLNGFRLRPVIKLAVLNIDQKSSAPSFYIIDVFVFNLMVKAFV